MDTNFQVNPLTLIFLLRPNDHYGGSVGSTAAADLVPKLGALQDFYVFFLLWCQFGSFKINVPAEDASGGRSEGETLPPVCGSLH